MNKPMTTEEIILLQQELSFDESANVTKHRLIATVDALTEKVKTVLEAKAGFCDALGDSERKVTAFEKELAEARAEIETLTAWKRLPGAQRQSNPLNAAQALAKANLEIIETNDNLDAENKRLRAVIDAHKNPKPAEIKTHDIACLKCGNRKLFKRDRANVVTEYFCGQCNGRCAIKIIPVKPDQPFVRNPDGKIWYSYKDPDSEYEDTCVLAEWAGLTSYRPMTPAEAFRPGAIIEYTTDVEREGEITKLKIEGTILEAYDFNDYITVVGLGHRATFATDKLTLVQPAPEEKS